MTDSGRDIDGNGLFEQLAATLSLDVAAAGDFAVLATLTSAGGDLIATGDLSPTVLTNAPATSVTLGAGPRTVPVYFNGRSIRDSGFDGPYTLTVELLDDGGAPADDASHTTSAYDAGDFQGAPVDFGTITDHADPGAIHVDVATDAAAAGDVALTAMLFAGDEQIGEVSRTQHLTAGAQTLTLDFDGEAIAATGIDGPYDVFISVADDLYVAEAQHTTAAYDAGDFTLPPAAFGGAITDTAVDDDADGDKDHLDVTAPLVARVAGTYTLRAVLEDSTGAFIASAEQSAALGAAPTGVTVSFPARTSAGRTRTVRIT